MSIFQKTIKVCLSTWLALVLAQGLSLSYASSAGVIAMLSLMDTRRSSLKLARSRLYATLLALGLASLIFWGLGFTTSSLFLFLLLYLPLGYVWRLDQGLAPSFVLVLHLYQEASLSWQLLGNELALFAIGVSLALLVNLYMPSKDRAIQEWHERVEDQLRLIMHRFEALLLAGDGSNQALLIGQLDQMLDQALALVYRERHNQLFHQTNYHVHYFDMRKAQTKILRRMAESLNQISQQSEESYILAQLFELAGQQISQMNSGQELLETIEDLLATFRQRDLPKTREEFERRATLFQLLQDMRQFISLKLDFHEQLHQVS